MSKGPYFQTAKGRVAILRHVTKEAKIPTLDFRPVSCVENRGLLKRRRSSFGTKKCLWKMINVQSWHQLWYTYDPKLLVSLFHSSCGSRFFVRAGEQPKRPFRYYFKDYHPIFLNVGAFRLDVWISLANTTVFFELWRKTSNLNLLAPNRMEGPWRVNCNLVVQICGLNLLFHITVLTDHQIINKGSVDFIIRQRPIKISGFSNKYYTNLRT